MIPSNFTMNTSNVMASLSTDLLGSASKTENTNFLESAFFSGLPVYYLQKQCTENSTFSFPLQIESYSIQQGDFIYNVSSFSPTKHFIIHSRKGLLNGISPVENRNIPPLKYEYFYGLLHDFPNLTFTINGGIFGIDEIELIRNLFVALFLASIGMLIHVHFLWNHVDSCHFLFSVVLLIFI
ncbi:hypothetical protein Ahy_B08g091767 [Arachis hypogaea]|uniref:Uncharacterized protein n=2 Tax=Arachis TaxID=3817 RepID=A0A444Y2N5_ARAHY|nr:hypothetical protein Ahy_B08g091767 [Arachis hypogaea]